MKNFLVLLAFFLLCRTAFSQDVRENTDSKSSYNGSVVDSLLYEDNLDKILFLYKNSKSNDSILSLAKENLELSKKNNYLKGVYTSYNTLVKIHSRLNISDSSLKYSSLCYNYMACWFNTSSSDEAYLYAGKNLQNIALVYNKKNNYHIALYIFSKANDIYKKIDNLSRQQNIEFSIGSVYTINGDYEKSLIHYKKAIEIFNSVEGAASPLLTYSNMGSVYIFMKQYDTALVYINLALSARLKSNSKDIARLARVYNNKGICHKHLNQEDSAMFYYEKSIDLFSKTELNSSISKVKVNIGIAYIDMKHYNKAEKILVQQIDLVKGVDDKTLVELYNALSIVYEKTNKYEKSLKYQKLTHLLRDSIQSEGVKNKIIEYKETYESDIRDKDIERLKQETSFQKLETENQKAKKENQKLISLVLIILVTALIIVVLFFRRNSKLIRISDKEKFANQENEKNQKILDLVKNQEITSINSFIEGQEKERNRIAVELHDRLGSLLSTVKLHFSSFEPEIKDEENKKGFNFAIDLLDNSVSEVRAISHNLSKGMITEFGLSHEIENLRDTINTAGIINIKYIIMGETISINPDKEIEIFRIIQEVVTNAIKHSQSDVIFIQQINNGNDISITIEDYGVGFNMKGIVKNGMGLGNLQNRASKIGAICTIDSIVGQGTTVTIDITKK